MSAPVIQADQLTRQFGAFTAVDRISFEVQRGEIFEVEIGAEIIPWL